MSVIVDARMEVVDTDIDISMHDRIELSASGAAGFGSKVGEYDLGSSGKIKDGRADLSLSSRARFSQFPVGALVGWIAHPDTPFASGFGENAFVVGTEKQVVEAKMDGRLYFAVNDWPGQYSNNTGHFEVTIMEAQSHKIIVYQHSGFNGNHREYITAAASLEALDNSVSSCKVVEGEWELFADSNFKGNSWVIGPGEYTNWTAMRVPNDHISSLRPKQA